MLLTKLKSRFWLKGNLHSIHHIEFQHVSLFRNKVLEDEIKKGSFGLELILSRMTGVLREQVQQETYDYKDYKV